MTTNTQGLPAEDVNLVETWLYADKARWAAGVIAGLFGGIVAMGLAGVLAKAGGMEFLFPVKLMGAAIIGPAATEVGPQMGGVIAGFALIEALGAFWGFIYSHFVKTNSLGALLAMGVVWGVFGWIFHWNLFFHSIREVLAANILPAAAFPVFIAYGVSLTSVAFFDKAFKGR